MENYKTSRITKATPFGVLVTMGIVFGDIGTSPLYVLRAIVAGSGGIINEALIYGSLSCIIWTLTLQTTIKYVVFTIRADNNGEGGIFSLYALVRKYARHAFVFAVIGGAMLLADGVITPSITVVSSVEGLNLIAPDIPILPIVLVIISLLFLVQQFGTKVLGKSFGPLMLIWFLVLAILGVSEIPQYPGIFNAFNPVYAIRLLSDSPFGFLLLGAVFLCTTGAEALYSDLGHCGRANIRISWAFVKTALILNYLGQGAWILNHPGEALNGGNPFFFMMPDWFVPIGVIIATIAAIIASQALISGSYTIIGEAIHLNVWPKVKIKYPSDIIGQLYIPSVNVLLWLACMLVIFVFRDSAHMEAAYGLAITLTMLMTTVLMAFYLRMKKRTWFLVVLFLLLYLPIEGSFLLSNLNKFSHGGWFTLFLGAIIIFIMLIWNKARSIKARFEDIVALQNYAGFFRDLKNDETLPRYASNLVFITRCNNIDLVERKIIHSVFYKQPKKADHYWLIRVRVVDNPYKVDFTVKELIPGVVSRIEFQLGFRVEPRINVLFHKVISTLAEKGEFDNISQYPSLRRHNVPTDFKYVVINRVQTYDFDFPPFEQFIMDIYEFFRRFGISDIKQFGLDTSNVEVEKVPMKIMPDSEK